MKFEEINYINIPIYKKEFIYFLINNSEVVYVGKTLEGLFRPLSHKNKIYDSINIIYNSNHILLEILEDYYINKYKPKYNKLINSEYILTKARNIFRKILDNDFTVRDLKTLMEDNHILVHNKNNKQYIKIEDMRKLILIFLGGN